ncbi:MAG TPA: hypothetical protein VF026_30395 [Ktedonobacteraceae bacterium]
MAPQHIQWGTITLHLDNEAFRRGFLSARQWYFADIYGEDGRAPQEPQHATALTSEEVLRLVVMPDEQGRSHFDEMGYLVGYLSGHLPPMKQSITAKTLPNRNTFVAVCQRRMTRDGKWSHPFLKSERHETDHHRQTEA